MEIFQAQTHASVLNLKSEAIDVEFAMMSMSHWVLMTGILICIYAICFQINKVFLKTGFKEL